MSYSFNKEVCTEQFILKLKRRQIVGSAQASLETANLLRLLISQTRWQTAENLLSSLTEIGSIIVKSQGLELAVGNTFRRVLKLIRDEYKSIPEQILSDDESSLKEDPQIRRPSKKKTENKSGLLFDDEYYQMRSTPPSDVAIDSSMYNLLANPFEVKESTNYHQSKYSLKPMIIQGINDLIDEVEDSRSSIASQSLDHIQNGEIIMTIGHSRTVEEFLIHAAKKRSFSVFVSETAPLYEGHILAQNLAKANIHCTIIPESAINAIMGKVNKVIIGCHAVMANGGLIAVTGSQLLATCAYHHSKPVVVVSGLYKLSPSFPSDKDLFYHTMAPSSVIPYNNDLIDVVNIVSPYYDYVDPNFVSLFITNTGGHPPSYLYRLLGEFYDARDDDFGSGS